MNDQVPNIEELCLDILAQDALATPGPWAHPLVQDGECLPDGTGYAGDWAADPRAVVRPAGPERDEADVAACPAPADAALIISFRAAAPALAREVLRLRAELAALKGAA